MYTSHGDLFNDTGYFAHFVHRIKSAERALLSPMIPSPYQHILCPKIAKATPVPRSRLEPNFLDHCYSAI